MKMGLGYILVLKMITRLLMFLNPRNVFVHLRMMKPKERNSQQPYNQRAVVVESFV